MRRGASSSGAAASFGAACSLFTSSFASSVGPIDAVWSASAIGASISISYKSKQV